MTMMTRLARLVRADLNAVLNRLEAPELVLGQAVRDMEQALDAERRAIAGLDRELTRLARRDRVLGEQAAECTEAIETGLADRAATDRDALVRPLIRRRLETARQRKALSSRIAELEAERDRLAARGEAHASRLDDLRSRAALAAPAAESPVDDPADPRWRAHGESAWSAPEAPVGEAEVELELIRLRRRGGAA